MKEIVTLARQDVYMFLVSAVRYALGRRSYIVGWACEQVRAIAPKLEDFQRRVIIESIRGCEDYGDRHSEREWLRLLEWLKNCNTPKIRKKKARR